LILRLGKTIAIELYILKNEDDPYSINLFKIGRRDILKGIWQPILCLDWLFKGEKNILNVGDCVFFDLNKDTLTPTISEFKFYKAVKITFQQNDWATKFNHYLADTFE